MKKEIKLNDGKYTIVYNFNPTSNESFIFKALRYGEEWRDLVGDNLIMSLIQEIEQTQQELVEQERWE